MIRCLRDADMASDGQSAPRPVLDVVFTSFEGIIKSALQAPVNACEWKLWEVPILEFMCTWTFPMFPVLLGSRHPRMPAHGVGCGWILPEAE
jgi:hypothetical protein